MYRILMVADHAWRDIPGLALLRVKLNALSPNLDVRIVDIHLLDNVVELFHPHLVVMNHLHDKARNKIVDNVIRRGGLCAVLPTEGRPNSNSAMAWASEFESGLSHLYLCWSEEAKRGIPESANPVVVGCQRFDFYYPPYSSEADSREVVCAKYDLDPSKPIVTVASSFPQGKFHKRGGDFAKRDWENLGVVKIDGRSDPEKVFEKEYFGLLKFQGWLMTLAREFPEYQILVKPHPAEDVRDWRMFCDGIGAALMPMDYIFNLLAASDVHVARVDCVTTAEAWILGKTVVQCDIGDVGREGAGLEAKDIGITAKKTSEFLDAVDAGIGLGSRSEKTSRYIEKWLGPMPGASERIANAIVSLLGARGPRTKNEPSPENWSNLTKMLVEHSNLHSVPTVDGIGQYAKTVREHDVYSWVSLIGSEKFWSLRE